MTAGALASALWQKTGKCPECVEIETPIGRRLRIPVVEASYGRCSVRKDGGDDPDVTDGCEIITSVEFIKDGKGQIFFEAGEGVGIITEPGLKLPVGEPAINPVPRKMAEEHLKPYMGSDSVKITVSVPNGEAIAAKTFNPRLGISGGISILGTTGIVRPMSEDAVKDSLVLELSQIYAKGYRHAVFVTGNQGHKMLEQQFGPLNPVIMVGNHIGFLLEKAADFGFSGILLGGQYGKLMKLAAGIFNTHSHIADGKMEILCTHAALHGACTEVIRALYECRTVKQADDLLKEFHLEGLWKDIVEKAEEKAAQCGRFRVKTGVVFLGNDGVIKAASSGAEEILKEVTVREA